MGFSGNLMVSLFSLATHTVYTTTPTSAPIKVPSERYSDLMVSLAFVNVSRSAHMAFVWPRVGLLTEKNAIKAHSPLYLRNQSLPHSVYAGAASIAPPSQILIAYRLSG